MLDKRCLGIIFMAFLLVSGCSKKYFLKSSPYIIKEQKSKEQKGPKDAKSAISPATNNISTPIKKTTESAIKNMDDRSSEGAISKTQLRAGELNATTSNSVPNTNEENIASSSSDSIPDSPEESTQTQTPDVTGKTKNVLASIQMPKDKSVPKPAPIETICEGLWEKAQTDKSLEGYREYLDKCPSGSYVSKAKAEMKRIEKLIEEVQAWEAARQTNKIEAYYAFAEKYPASGHTNIALQHCRSDYWQRQVNKSVNKSVSKNDCLHNSIQLGWAYYRERELEKAGSIFKEKEKLAPYNEEIQLALGKIYYSLGQTKLALKHLGKAVSSDSNSAEAWFYKGRCYEKFSSSKAIDCFNKAIELNSAYTAAYFHRGALHRLVLNFKAAVKDFKKVLDLSDNQQLLDYAKNMISHFSTK